MYIFRLFIRLTGVTLLSIMASLSVATAIPVSGNENNTQTETTHQVSNGSVDIEQTIEYDPNAGAWLKHIENDPSAPLDPFFLHETIIIGGDIWWTDWHEEILTPDWEWGDIQISVFDAAGTEILDGITWEKSTDMVWFFFDPLAPGGSLNLWKEIIYTGSILPQPCVMTVIDIIEYPTVSEPSIMPLLGLSLLIIGLYRKKISQEL